MHSQTTYKKSLFCSWWLAVYSSADRQLVWGLVMGFSIVFRRDSTMQSLASRHTVVLGSWTPHQQGFTNAHCLGRWLAQGRSFQ